MSAAKVETRGMGFIGTKSTPSSEKKVVDVRSEWARYGVEARTDDETVHGHVFARYLQPTTGCGTQVDTAS